MWPRSPTRYPPQHRACRQMREILGVLRRQSCGWNQDVNQICICGAGVAAGFGASAIVRLALVGVLVASGVQYLRERR